MPLSLANFICEMHFRKSQADFLNSYIYENKFVKNRKYTRLFHNFKWNVDRLLLWFLSTNFPNPFLHCSSTFAIFVRNSVFPLRTEIFVRSSIFPLGTEITEQCLGTCTTGLHRTYIVCIRLFIHLTSWDMKIKLVRSPMCTLVR